MIRKRKHTLVVGQLQSAYFFAQRDKRFVIFGNRFVVFFLQTRYRFEFTPVVTITHSVREHKTQGVN